MPYNQYGVPGFGAWEKKTFRYDWLGASVSFIFLGQWVRGKVVETNGVDETIVAEVWDGNKKALIEMYYKVARKMG